MTWLGTREIPNPFDGPTFSRGMIVRFLTGPLGLMADKEGNGRFLDATVAKGDTGTYWGAHLSLPEWELVQVGDAWCPVHSSMIERVDG